ncbi:MAG: hypothetical protein ACHQQS_03985 [Thermoanaerobaculales bacterium]
MKLFGNGGAVLADDSATAERLGWARRRRSAPEPEYVLHPREGDPRGEPWIAAPGWHPRFGLEPPAPRRVRSRGWTYLAETPGVLRYLERLAAPPACAGVTVGIAGLGRVGGVAATLLAAMTTRASGVRELLVYDLDAANQERWLLELGSIAVWRGRYPLPSVRAATVDEMMRACDVVLFVAATGVPPLGAEGDVRLVQFEPNRMLLEPFLRTARRAEFAGLFLIVSDPVDRLAQASFHDSNCDGRGRFDGNGLAPERVGGLGLGVMWARALAAARRHGWEGSVSRHGAAFGPHSAEVIAFDDVRAPDRERSEMLTRAARQCNYKVRELGFLPYVGPGVSSVALALPRLLSGAEVLASVLIDGIYFGAPSRLKWGIWPAPRRMVPEVWAAVNDLHARLQAQTNDLGLLW